jgi:hypothetical protein
MPDNEQTDDSTEEADRRNGEPNATENHQTGVEQAEENKQNDPPA